MSIRGRDRVRGVLRPRIQELGGDRKGFRTDDEESPKLLPSNPLTVSTSSCYSDPTSSTRTEPVYNPSDPDSHRLRGVAKEGVKPETGLPSRLSSVTLRRPTVLVPRTYPREALPTTGRRPEGGKRKWESRNKKGVDHRPSHHYRKLLQTGLA